MTFSTVLLHNYSQFGAQSRRCIFEPLPFYLCLLTFWSPDAVSISQPACLAARGQINASPAQRWFVEAICVFGGSLVVLLSELKRTRASLRFKEVQSRTWYNRLKNKVLNLSIRHFPNTSSPAWGNVKAKSTTITDKGPKKERKKLQCGLSLISGIPCAVVKFETSVLSKAW